MGVSAPGTAVLGLCDYRKC